MLQSRPIREPAMMCEKCQTLVPSPISAPSSTYADSWTKKLVVMRRLDADAGNSWLGGRLNLVGSDSMGKRNRGSGLFDAEATAFEYVLVDLRVQVDKAFAELNLRTIDADRT